MNKIHLKLQQNDQLTRLIFYSTIIILVQLPMVTFYYKNKKSFERIPVQTGYYDDLGRFLKYKVAKKMEFIHMDEDGEVGESGVSYPVSDAASNDHNLIKNQDQKDPNQKTQKEIRFHIMTQVVNTFINLIMQTKVVLNTDQETEDAVNDILTRIEQGIKQEEDERTEVEDAVDLSELLTHITNEYKSNATKIKMYDEVYSFSSVTAGRKSFEVCSQSSTVVAGASASLASVADDTGHSPKNALVGPLRIDFDIKMPQETDINNKFENKFVETSGGHFIPNSCKPKFRVAICVPFRNRQEHLMYFLWYMHPILQRQDIEYKIYIINQLGSTPFNRAQLLNIGFVESLKDYQYWDCFIFHDVDLVPENDHMLYHCPTLPRHMSVAVDKFRYQLPYSTIFGGATAFTKSQFLTLNGYSNKFSGWGGEDDDMFRRLYLAQMNIQRPDNKIGRYRMIRHTKDETNKANPERFKLLKNVKSRWKLDGLNSLLETYRRIAVEEHYSYTMVSIQVIG